MSESKLDFGEPWNIACVSDRSVFIDNNGGITVASAGQLLWDEGNNTSTAERLVACVNACAGVRNPDKLRELVEAAKSVGLVANCYCGEEKCAYCRIESALAALEAEQ